MSEQAIRELTASIILGIYRNHVDKYNTLDDFMKDYSEILKMITPRLEIEPIKPMTAEEFFKVRGDKE